MSAADAADWNPRWLACAAAQGVARDQLRNVDFICWIRRQSDAFRAARGLRGSRMMTEADHDAFTAHLWDVARRAG